MEWNWNKTSINLPYSYENLKTLLDAVCKKENQFSQVDFCMWCDNLTMAWEEEDLNDQDELAFSIARDIECQWDLYDHGFSSYEKLMKEDLSKLELPHEWFREWEIKLETK